ncbi:MAG TPA: hypothetical protein VHB97_21490 [Polyangia bacterium]|nr:hypothetical protein [Polyangia bacterium]
MFLRSLIAVCVLVTVAGCGPKATKRACMGGAGGNALVDGAAMMRLDVYGASAQCVGGLLADGSGSPLVSHTYLAGQPIMLDVPPGPHVLVLTTYADEAGMMVLGEGCTATTLEAGSQICFDLTVGPAPVQDLSATSSTCTVTPNSCPPGYYCDSNNCLNGCAADTDCNGSGPDAGATVTPFCDPISHTCVECVTTSQCGPSQSCNDGHCVANCTSTQTVCNGSCIASGSCCTAADCASPPAPAACYAGKCATAGGSCSYAVKTGSVVCGSTCCNAINGTCNNSCVLTCTAGFANCNGDPSDGCETNLGAAGKKLCSNGACVPVGTCCSSSECTTPPSPAACYKAAGTCSGPGGTCMYTENSGSQICNNNTTCCNAIDGMCGGTCGLTCTSGYFDCNANPADGCETACAPANSTGKCAGTSGCAIASCNSGFQNCNGSVTDGCECGTSCCTNPMSGMSDCLVNNHTDGWGHTFSACYPLGKPGTSSTAGTGYGLQFAQDAATADISVVGNCTTDTQCAGVYSGATCVNGACIWPTAKCYSGQDYVQSLCKFAISNGGSGNKASDCACWAYSGTSGSCSGGTPCQNLIGNTNHVISNYCPCVSLGATYQ